jgi:putative transposase
MLGKTLTGWRAARTRLREGASVPQQQTVRDFAASRSKALEDVKDRLPVQRRAAKALKKVARQRQDTARKWARKVIRDHDAIAVEDLKPTFLAKTTMARKAADAAIGQAEQALVDLGREHGRDVRLVHPAYTSMHCGDCGARAKHRLPLSERVYTRTVCGVSRPRDKDSAHVVLVRAGLDPAGAEGVRPGRPQDVRAA